jgi:teichuronic acid biosynthesis glycosyltransferase TuaC
MRILAAAPAFPSAAHPFAGIFTAKIVATLRELGHDVTVLCPTPYVPPGFGNVGRWKQYAGIQKQSVYDGVPVYQPATPVIPRLLQAFWSDEAAWLGTRRYVKRLHLQRPFEVVIGFDLGGAGGLAWRLARDLGISSAGWAYGSEVRVDPATGPGKSIRQAIESLDVVFYQSAELRECAETMVRRELTTAARHVVLPHGIRLGEAMPPSPDSITDLRRSWGASPDDRIVLSVGRVRRDKGVFDLFEAFTTIASSQPKSRLVIIGAMPPRDASEELQTLIAGSPHRNRISVMPALDPTLVPAALATAEVFAFTSYLEGMPNVVLEALDARRAIVAFDIPPLREADPNGDAIVLIPKADSSALASAIERILDHPGEQSARIASGAALVRERFDMSKNLSRAVEIIESTRAS